MPQSTTQSAITLPWPPTVNHYWKVNWKQRKFRISTAGGEYIREIKALSILNNWEKFGDKRLSVEIYLYPPDKRKRDIDNVCKSLLDVMEKTNIYNNDNQVDRLLLVRKQKEKPGRVEIYITEIPHDEKSQTDTSSDIG